MRLSSRERWAAPVPVPGKPGTAHWADRQRGWIATLRVTWTDAELRQAGT
jgi:hypothetical protein